MRRRATARRSPRIVPAACTSPSEQLDAPRLRRLSGHRLRSNPHTRSTSSTAAIRLSGHMPGLDGTKVPFRAARMPGDSWFASVSNCPATRHVAAAARGAFPRASGKPQGGESAKASQEGSGEAGGEAGGGEARGEEARGEAGGGEARGEEARREAGGGEARGKEARREAGPREARSEEAGDQEGPREARGRASHHNSYACRADGRRVDSIEHVPGASDQRGAPRLFHPSRHR